MNDKEIIVAYPHEIKFIDKNGGAISYYVDRKVSDCVKKLQDKLSKIESENIQKDIDKLQLQSNWNSLRECIQDMIYTIEPKGTGINYNCEYDSEEDFIDAMKEQSKLNTLKFVLDKMDELEGNDIE